MQLCSGVWTALVTPFNEDGSVDTAAFRKLVKRQLDAGVHALLPCGTTGEAMTLLDAEKIELVKICVELSQGKVPVVAGAGNNDTRQAIATHLQMKEAGATAALHVTPYYNKPTQEGLYLHFEAIAQSCDLPIILYNNPTRTAVDMLPGTVLRLVQKYANIVAIKETTPDLARLQTMIVELKRQRPEFLVFAGEDALVFPLLAMGGDGVISTSSNFAPEIFCDVFKAVGSNQLQSAQEHYAKVAQLAPLMFMSTNPIPVKTALSFLGLIKNNYRLPLCPMSTSETEFLRAQLTMQGWL